MTTFPLRRRGHPTPTPLPLSRLAAGGVALFSLGMLGLPMSGLQLAQMQALNRELGKLCNDPPQKALIVCRLHAQLVRGH